MKSGELSNMFIGQYQHSIDEKGRLAFPAKFRKELSEGAVVTKGLDGCLFVFSRKKFIQMAENISRLPYTKSSARLYSRLILASACDLEFDKQGRVILPAFLRDYAKLKTEAIVGGLYDRVEIWSKKSWKDLSQIADKDAGEIVEELSEIDI